MKARHWLLIWFACLGGFGILYDLDDYTTGRVIDCKVQLKDYTKAGYKSTTRPYLALEDPQAVLFDEFVTEQQWNQAKVSGYIKARVSDFKVHKDTVKIFLFIVLKWFLLCFSILAVIIYCCEDQIKNIK